jgi:hypothetical protein
MVTEAIEKKAVSGVQSGAASVKKAAQSVQNVGREGKAIVGRAMRSMTIKAKRKPWVTAAIIGVAGAAIGFLLGRRMRSATEV